MTEKQLRESYHKIEEPVIHKGESSKKKNTKHLALKEDWLQETQRCGRY